ncbi:hypothetical protein [Halovivax limisalsi]|uniref:hypothetical protein n=1 Tax=Halovivax limisalsi TaxID=1453760 RepID=UPI001FFC95E4|nr:hypothetical protein [Halovivax limisalsi]
MAPFGLAPPPGPLQAAVSLSVHERSIEFVVERSLGGRVAIAVLTTLVLALILVGILPDYSRRTIELARASPIISVLVGLPATLVLGAFLALAMLLSESSLGIFFAIPLVSVSVGLLPAWTVLGVVALGRTLDARVGRDSLPTGIVAASICAGLAALSMELLLVFTTIVACLGAGAGARVLVGGSTTTDPDDRTVPPANKF